MISNAIRRRQRGAALVIALAFLVLLSALIVAFFSSVTSEHQQARNYKSGTVVQQLVSSVTNIVTGQLVDATRSMKTPSAAGATAAIPAGERLAWASQPGMIRTWDDTGAGWKIFKLYSNANMVVDFDASGAYSTEANLPLEIPPDWAAQKARFTDLNQPVLAEDAGGAIQRNGRTFRASYPIVDPLAMLPTTTASKVDGFSIQSPPGYAGEINGTGSPAFSGATDPTLSVSGMTNNPAPMPVQWIYVLRDGTLTTPTGSEAAGRTATWSNVAGAHSPSQNNPIVGRIAFWTDDETSKLNINTASEPTPWDTPRAVTIQDLKYGRFQPAEHEYQRFPGHPFMTALSPVLFPGTTLTTAQKEAIYALIPRVQPGGSTAGTVGIGDALSSITPDHDRLFANADEILFEPTQRALLSADPRFDSLHLDAERLRRARFFLTANSRAPEINLYGQPRISLWPVPFAAADRMTYDKTAAFCSTLGEPATSIPAPFYFQRRDCNSATSDWTGIPRNQDLFSYLQHLTSSAVPGFGGTFLAKWGADRDQVLTEIFDYIRCTNLSDSQTGATKFAPLGQVAPLQILQDQTGAAIDTQGFGRFHTISQFVLHFVCSQQGSSGLSTVANSGQPALAAGERALEAALYLEPFSPALGYSRIEEQVFYQVTFKTPLRVDGQDLLFPANATGGLNNSIKSVIHGTGRERGGAGGIRGPIRGMGAGNYPLVSQAAPRVVVGKNGRTTMDLSGGEIEVKVFAGTDASGSLIQTFHIQIPEGPIPVPDLVPTGTGEGRGAAATTPQTWWTLKSRLATTNATPYLPSVAEYPTHPERTWAADNAGFDPGFKRGSVIRKEDVVRALVPNHGDIRLIAARRVVASNCFGPVADWASDQKIQHIISEAAGTQFMYGNANEPGITSGPLDQLVPSASVKYHWARLPEIKAGAGALYNRWNDFDNGVSIWTDGAYINKPDEGNLTASHGYNYFAYSIDDSLEYLRPRTFSPNRLMPSAGMLGSLPTGIKRHQDGSAQPADRHAWETLLFRPQAGHPGQAAGAPRDHLIMDLFWMPVIEPYAISEPFSTAGKINLNYEIAPFSYIRRATALHGAMKSEEPLLLPNEIAKVYKLWDHEVNDAGSLPSSSKTKDAQVRADWGKAFNGTAPFDKLRRPIDIEQTLSQCDTRFKSGEIFRAASQICELHLVRQGETLSDYLSGAIWQRNLITGDNTRERPYANLYARLTTRSNSYTIHMRVQVLQQIGGKNAGDWAKWREGTDAELSEYRGSSLVERYIDPADPNLPDFATNANATVDHAYRLRVVSSKKFAP